MALQFKNHGVLAKILKESGFTHGSQFPRTRCISNYLLKTIVTVGEFVITPEDLICYKVISVNSGHLTQEFVKLLHEKKFIVRLSHEKYFSKIEFKLGPKLKDIIEKELDYKAGLEPIKVIENRLTTEEVFDYTKKLINTFDPPYTIEKHKLWYETGIKACKE